MPSKSKANKAALAFLGFLAAYTHGSHQARAAQFKDVQTVVCAGGSICMEAVGKLITPLGACTASLAAPNIIVTASHCLSPKPGGHFILPATSKFKAEDIGLDKILFDGQNKAQTPIGLDVAFVKLKSSSHRTPLKIDNAGIGDNENLLAYKIHNAGAYLSNQFVSHCRAIQNSMINPLFRKNSSPMFAATDCHIIPSDSGSPVLGKDGRIKGIITELFVRPQLDETVLRQMEIAMGVNNLYEAYDKVAGGTNLACVPTLTSGFSNLLPKACGDKSGENMGEREVAIERLFNDGLRGTLHREFQNDEWFNRFSKGKQWKVIIDRTPEIAGSHLSYTRLSAKPNCILQNDEPVSASAPTSASTRVRNWDIALKISENFRPVYEVKRSVGEMVSSKLPKCDKSESDVLVMVDATKPKN